MDRRSKPGRAQVAPFARWCPLRPGCHKRARDLCSEAPAGGQQLCDDYGMYFCILCDYNIFFLLSVL